MSRAAWQPGSATNRSLRQRIATQHSVGREETRMPCGMSVRDSESRTARVSVATVAVVARASGRTAVAAEAKYTRETPWIPKTLAVVRH